MAMTHYDIVKKLIGHINPVGETDTDERRLKGLNETIELVELLMGDIADVAKYRHRSEHSMQLAGKTAHDFMERLK